MDIPKSVQLSVTSMTITGGSVVSQDNGGDTKTLGQTVASTHCAKCGGLIGRVDFYINPGGTRTHGRCDPDNKTGIYVKVCEVTEPPVCEECGHTIEGVICTTTSGGAICVDCADDNPELVGYEGLDGLIDVPIDGQD